MSLPLSNKEGSLTRGTLSKSEEELDCAPQTDNFWDIGNYRKVVRLVDDGAKLCLDLVKMAQERAEIEAKYSKHLHQWSKKWEELVNKGPEYGTLQNGWKAVLNEASRQADLHEEISKKIKDLSKSVTKWQSFHYHRSLSGRWKESKAAEEGFHSAQKLWAKNMSHCTKAKKAYHQSSHDFMVVTQSLEEAENSQGDIEHVQKLREKKEKLEKEREKNKLKYQSCLTNVYHDKDRYVREMRCEFEKCQVFEKIRMEFFKETLIKMKSLVDLTKDERVSCIYQLCDHTLSQINSSEDLQWYSLHFGPDMVYSWPVYEEYKLLDTTEAQGTLSSSHSSNYSLDAPRTHSDGSNEDLQNESPLHKPCQQLSESAWNDEYSSTDHIYESTDNWPEPSTLPDPLETLSETKREIPEEGILMRALYCYVGDDDDDLSFNEGDVVRFLEYCNGGWAKALLNEEYGYVPESYFEPLI